jgi:hypothetical protein
MAFWGVVKGSWKRCLMRGMAVGQIVLQIIHLSFIDESSHTGISRPDEHHMPDTVLNSTQKKTKKIIFVKKFAKKKWFWFEVKWKFLKNFVWHVSGNWFPSGMKTSTGQVKVDDVW